MPLLRIDLYEGRTDAELKVLLDAVHKLISVLAIAVYRTCESGTDTKHGRPVVVVMAVEEFERLNVSAPTATGMRVKRSNLQQIEKRGAIRRAYHPLNTKRTKDRRAV